MTKTKYHTFDLGRAGKGSVDVRYGVLQYVHEDVSPSSNLMGLGVCHVYNSAFAISFPDWTHDERAFEIKLSPEYDEDNLSDFYKADGKAQVIKHSNGRFDEIRDRNNPGKFIKFMYTGTAPLFWLDKIIDTKGREIQFLTTEGTLDKIVYPDNESTSFLYTLPPNIVGTGTHMCKISSTNKTGMKINLNNFMQVEGLYNTVDFNSISTLGTTASSSTKPYNETSFVYLATENKTTKSYANGKVVYSFSNSAQPADWEAGITKEEVFVNNFSTAVITYARNYVSLGKQEIICYNPTKDDEVKITRVYENNFSGKGEKLLQEITESKYYQIGDGAVVSDRYRTIIKTFSYNNSTDKLMSETTLVGFKSSKINQTNDISETTYKTDYLYDTDTKLYKIENRINGALGIVQQKVSDANPNLEKWETYRVNTSNPKICSKKLLDSSDRPKIMYDERGYGTAVEYLDGTQLIKEITDPENNKTELKYFADNYKLKSISALSGSVNNKNEFLYTGDILTRAVSPSTTYDFEYLSKTADFLSKENVRLHDPMLLSAPLVSHVTKTESAQDTTTSIYDGKTVRTTLDKAGSNEGKENVQFSPDGSTWQDILTNTPKDTDKTQLDSSEDCLAHTVTKYAYDPQGNVIATENEQIKSTVTTDNRGRLSGTKHTIKPLGNVQTYGYGYTTTGEEKLRMIHNPLNSESMYYDTLGRPEILTVNGLETTYKYKKDLSNNYTTTFVEDIVRDVGTLSYDYDSRGNISMAYDKDAMGNKALKAKYYYDALNRLSREDNLRLNETYAYEYDANGNITLKKIYSPYVSAPSLNGLPTAKVISYTYKAISKEWPQQQFSYSTVTDQLSWFGNEKCTYNDFGNPTLYRDMVMEWEHIRNLKAMHTPNGAVEFEYNAQGLRISKTKGDNSTTYYYAGDRLAAERIRTGSGEGNLDIPFELNGNCYLTAPGTFTDIQYLYGFNGISAMLLTKNGTAQTYYFRKNLLGDITHICNSNNVVLAQYVYDAWGNHKVLNPNGTENTDPTFIGNVNPFRYRGYYYDIETNLYYLKSRYYDPETGRFINMDNARVLKQSMHMINGLNLFAYCGNNPIMRTDYSGKSWWDDLWNGVGGLLSDFWNGVKYITNDLGNFASTNIGVAVLETFEFTGFSMDTLLGGWETGLSSSLGSSDKFLTLYVKKASAWWKFWEYQIGARYNFGNGGFDISIGIGELNIAVGTNDFYFGLMVGVNKIGFVSSGDASWGNFSIGNYTHGYIRTLPLAFAVALAWYSKGLIIPIYNALRPVLA